MARSNLSNAQSRQRSSKKANDFESLSHGVPKITVRNVNKRLIAAGIILLVISSYMWWVKVYNSSQSVFWGMLDNSLATSSITRHVLEKQPGSSLDRFTRLQTGSTNASQTLEFTSQATTAITKETIGTPSIDYARYAAIRTEQKTGSGKPVNFSKVEGVWGKSPDVPTGQTPQVQYFVQALLGTVPFADLTHDQRQSLVKFIHDKNVYQTTYNDAKSAKENGQTVYIYKVQINAQAYFEMLQQFVKDLGLPDVPGLDPSAYVHVAPLVVQFTIAKTSRELTKISYPSTNQVEFYSDYGLIRPVTLPAKTIPISELQNRIQNLD